MKGTLFAFAIAALVAMFFWWAPWASEPSEQDPATTVAQSEAQPEAAEFDDQALQRTPSESSSTKTDVEAGSKAENAAPPLAEIDPTTIHLHVTDREGQPVPGVGLSVVRRIKESGDEVRHSCRGVTGTADGILIIPFKDIWDPNPMLKAMATKERLDLILGGGVVGNISFPDSPPESGILEAVIDAPGWLEAYSPATESIGEDQHYAVRIWPQQDSDNNVSRSLYMVPFGVPTRLPVPAGRAFSTSAGWTKDWRRAGSGGREPMPPLRSGEVVRKEFTMKFGKSFGLTLLLPDGTPVVSHHIKLTRLPEGYSRSEEIPQVPGVSRRDSEFRHTNDGRIYFGAYKPWVGSHLEIAVEYPGTNRTPLRAWLSVPEQASQEELTDLGEVQTQALEESLVCSGHVKHGPRDNISMPSVRIFTKPYSHMPVWRIEINENSGKLKVWVPSVHVEELAGKELFLQFFGGNYKKSPEIPFRFGDESLVIPLDQENPMFPDR